MTSPVSASSSFSALTSTGDAIAVLVLVEISGVMQTYWDDVKSSYLPMLLDTLRDAHDIKTIPMRVCWQTSQTVFSGNQSSSLGDASGKEIPDIRFDPASTSAVSTTALRYSIETLKAAFRDQHATRHFIVVAASSPIDDYSQTIFEPTALQAIASMLRQEQIRFHMILGTGSSTQVYHQLHQQVLHPQNCRAIPLWFSADTSKFNILLMSKPSASLMEGSSSFSTSASPQSSDTPISTGSSLPASPNPNDASASDRRKSMSPQTRRGRPGMVEQPAHGLVSYLQQMHGLTKKRTYGGAKTAKRASTGDVSRTSSSSTRPILPRLDLPDHKSRGFAPYPTMGSPTSERGHGVKSASSSQPSRYIPIAPASPPHSASEDGQRARSRWPWLQPTPPPSLTSGTSSTTSGAANALRSLAMMTPRHPELAARLPDLSSARSGSMAPLTTQMHGYSDLHHDTTGPPISSQREPTDWYTRQRSSTIATSNPTDYRMSTSPSPTHTHAVPYRPSWLPGNYTDLHEYSSYDDLTPTHDHVHHSYTHMIPPPPLVQQPNHTDPGDAPFLITPEFEALANARFDAAVRSGAMQASMTAATLGPAAGDPSMSGHQHGADSNAPDNFIPAPMPGYHEPPHTMHGGPPPSMTPQARAASGPNEPVYQAHGDHVPHGGNLHGPDPTQNRWFGLM